MVLSKLWQHSLTVYCIYVTLRNDVPCLISLRYFMNYDIFIHFTFLCFNVLWLKERGRACIENTITWPYLFMYVLVCGSEILRCYSLLDRILFIV